MPKRWITLLTTLAVGGGVALEAVADDPRDRVKGTCVKVFERQRTCTDAFIPSLVDARIASDVPSGIAARARSEGRDALIAAARAEWTGDSKDASIAARCEEVASSPKGPAFASAGETCLARTACSAFAACIVPVVVSKR